MIKTWIHRCQEHPDHQTGMVSHTMIQARMQEEIHELRAALAQPEPEPARWEMTDIERFAALVADSERKACAAFLERGVDLSGLADDPVVQNYTVEVLLGCAAAIRARGEHMTLKRCSGACDQGDLIADLDAALAQPEPEPVEQLNRIHPLDIPLDVFVEDLSTRPRNIINAEMRYFTNSGDEYMKPPFTVRHLLMFSRKELRKWPNFGKRSLNEIEEMLRNRGLQLWEEHDERSLSLLRIHPTYYSSPPQRQPLTEEEIYKLFGWYAMPFVRAIERQHGIGEWWPVFQRAAADSEGGEV